MHCKVDRLFQPFGIFAGYYNAIDHYLDEVVFVTVNTHAVNNLLYFTVNTNMYKTLASYLLE